MHIIIRPARLSVHYVCTVPTEASWILELQTVVRSHEAIKNQAAVLGKSS